MEQSEELSEQQKEQLKEEAKKRAEQRRLNQLNVSGKDIFTQMEFYK